MSGCGQACRRKRRNGIDDATSAIEGALPVRLVQTHDFDRLATRGCVDELVVAEIDADMRELEASSIEEHEIARLQFMDRDLGTHLSLIAGASRQGDASGLLEDVADEATAIEATFGILAAELVANPDQGKGVLGDLVDSLGGTTGEVLELPFEPFQGRMSRRFGLRVLS